MTKKIFASSIGRTFEIINQNEVMFVHKITENQWRLKAYNLTTEKSRVIAEMPRSTEDFIINEDGIIFCATNSKILRLTNDGRWQTTIDLLPLNIQKISRLAINKNRIVVVSITK